MVGTTANATTYKQAHQFTQEQAHFGCVVTEAQHWRIPLHDFLAINSIERGRTKPIGNSNGSQDLGAFQVNTIHLSDVANKFGGTKNDLLYKGCFNAHVAGWLMHRALNEPSKRHLDYYTRLAGYHSWTPSVNAVYRRKLVDYTAQWQRWLNQNSQNVQAIAQPVMMQTAQTQQMPVAYPVTNQRMVTLGAKSY